MNKNLFFKLQTSDIAELARDGVDAAKKITEERKPDEIDFTYLIIRRIFSSQLTPTYEMQVAICQDIRDDSFYLRWYERDMTED